ncbi:MAG: short-chain dehydrogenase/reductase [Gammaproteobacteria bacterium]|nr:short-chain dehydrogenase/reductase [Gammaproteobacteria bacterium]
MREVSGKVAFITGGASGIGLGIAKAFLAAGMRVAIADVRLDHLDTAVTELGTSADVAHAIQLDVADRDAMERAAAEVVRVFGKVHVVCNNAGIGLLGSVKDASFADWDWMTAVNLNGVFNGVHAFLPHLRAHAEGGHIVSTASMGGLMVGNNAGVYSACKFGVVSMMECLREDLADEHIGVSVLCPAAVRTNIYQHEGMRPACYAQSGYDSSAEGRAQMEARIKGMLNLGMDPIEVGRRVLQGILNNDLYIFTHRMDEVIRERRDAILASLPHEPINEERLAMDMQLRALMKESLKRT